MGLQSHAQHFNFLRCNGKGKSFTRRGKGVNEANLGVVHCNSTPGDTQLLNITEICLPISKDDRENLASRGNVASNRVGSLAE